MASALMISTLDALARILSKRARDIEAGTCSGDVGDNVDMRREVMITLGGLESSDRDSHHPANMMMWFMSQFSYFTAIRLFTEWGAFEQVPTAKGAAISYTELAARLHAGTDAALIGRSLPEPLHRGFPPSSVGLLTPAQPA